MDGKTVYYIIKASDTIYDSLSNAGTLYCISCVNLTLKNLNLNKNGKGIYFRNTSQSRIQNVTASNNNIGIYLESSSNNTLSSNNAANNRDSGISLISSSNNTLSGNNASNNGAGISLSSSSNNKLSDNNSSNNNNIGISLVFSNNNTLIGNNASNNNIGISLVSSSNNTLSGNIMTGNYRNFNLDGDTDADFDNHIDIGNLVDGRSIYYIIKASDTIYDSSSNAGAFYCISCVNVTLKDLNLNGYGVFFWNTTLSKIQNIKVYYNNSDSGIFLSSSSSNTLIGNTVLNNGKSDNYGYGYGIILSDSSSNMLSNNNASNNGVGIFLEYSSNNTLIGNNASLNGYGGGIYLEHSNNNKLRGNNASNNRGGGISLDWANNNTLSGNNASNNRFGGISLSYSSSNTLIGNNASNNRYGIQISSDKESEDGDAEYYCTNNTLKNNIMTGNMYNFELDAHRCSDFQNIDKSNLVDGKPIYYIRGASNTIYDSSTNAGTFYCINCVNVTLKDLNLTNNGYGVFFSSTTLSKIQNVKVYNNSDYGIYLYYSSNNTLTGNNASNNWNGIYLYSSSNNKIFNNIFSDNNNVFLYSSINTWNTTKQSGTNIIGGPYLGGNFWTKPDGTGFSQTCLDVNGDGICDQSYIDENHIDYLPLAKDKIPPKSVSNLKNVSYASSYIKWTWTDPKDSDFDKVQIYINNIYKTSVLKGLQYYKANNLYGNRSYTISTRTVDKSGNVNLTWKNNTSRTKPDIVPPMNVSNLKNITYARNYINWTWKDPKDIDFKKVMVVIDSKFKRNVSKGKMYFNATNFAPNTSHTISTWTVDMNGNINKTWTNSSAWTASITV